MPRFFIPGRARGLYMFGLTTHGPRLAAILVCALGLRVASAVSVQQWVDQTPGRLCLISGDAEGYWELASKLVRHEDFAIYDPPRHILRMPGFPLLLAGGMEIFGEHPLPLRLLLAAIGTAGCGLVYWLGAELFGHSAGLLASGLAAVSPTFVVFSVLFLSETLFAVMLLGCLISLVLLVKAGATERRSETWEGEAPAEPRTSEEHGSAGASPSRRPASRKSHESDIGRGHAPNSQKPWRSKVNLCAVMAGVLCGLATLVRPTWLLVGPGFVLIYVALAPSPRRALVPAGLLLAALAVTMTPWVIRNAWVSGHFVPTTLWAGPSLYDGLNPHATGASDMSFVETDGLYRALSEYDADRHYARAAWDFLRQNPGRGLKLAPIKAGRFWNPIPNADQFGHWGIQLVVAAFTLPIFALAVGGAWRARKMSRGWWIALAPIVYFTLVHSVFIGSLRYRLPVEYPLVVLSAVGLQSCFRRRENLPTQKPASLSVPGMMP